MISLPVSVITALVAWAIAGNAKEPETEASEAASAAAAAETA